MDFRLTKGLDLEIEDGIFVEENDSSTAILCGFFTDDRVNNRRGYWGDLKKSTLWIFDQARVNTETVDRMQEETKEIAKSLVDDGLFDRIDAEATIKGKDFGLKVKCFDKAGKVVLDRMFQV